MDAPFVGAKIALMIGPGLLAYRRDVRPGLVWPGWWDLPGGGREGRESPLACALRETAEEFGLAVPRRAVTWARRYRSPGDGPAWFFAARLPMAARGRIRFGEEGQHWRLVEPRGFAAWPAAIPMFRTRVRHALDAGL